MKAPVPVLTTTQASATSAPITPVVTPWLSIVIPTLNEAEHLPRTLALLREELPGGLPEIIIADGGSTDATVTIARSYGCRVVTSAPGRSRQLNAGAAAAQSSHLWFLHADTLPPATWATELRGVLAAGGAASFRLRFDHGRRVSLLSVYSWLSRFDLDAFRFGDQSLFVSRRDFRRAGGYDERMRILEDNDLVRRLRRQRTRLTLLPGRVTTSARAYRRHGTVYTQAVYVLLYAAYRCGASNEWLFGCFRRAFA